MNKIIFTLLMLPVLCFAADVEIPKEVSDGVEKMITTTVSLPCILVAVVQALKKISAGFKYDISGIKSQALAIGIAVVFVLVNLEVWNDGVLTPNDWVLIIQGIISAVAGVFGYKLLWRKTETKTDEKKEPVK